MEIHKPGNTKLVTEMYAYLSVDEGGEGLIGGPIGPNGSVMPLVAADLARVDSLRPMAEMIAAHAGVTIQLVRFRTREDLETINPTAVDIV